jgi:protein-S-isoprenylcysteine O-methyltransferase Ste14
MSEHSTTIGFSRSWLIYGGTPTLFISTFLLCIFIEHNYKIKKIFSSSSYYHKTIRFLISYIVGFVAVRNVLDTLSKMRTTGVLHSKATVFIIHNGCFNECRNPIYSYIVMLYFSLAVIYNSRCIFAGGFFCLLYLSLLVVPAEEEFLNEHFGKEYQKLIQKTPCRWCFYPMFCSA